MNTDTVNGARGYGALAGKTGNFQGQPAVEYTTMYGWPDRSRGRFRDYV